MSKKLSPDAALGRNLLIIISISTILFLVLFYVSVKSDNQKMNQMKNAVPEQINHSSPASNEMQSEQPDMMTQHAESH